MGVNLKHKAGRLCDTVYITVNGIVFMLAAEEAFVEAPPPPLRKAVRMQLLYYLCYNVISYSTLNILFINEFYLYNQNLDRKQKQSGIESNEN